MSLDNLVKSALPKGKAWSPKQGGFYDIILQTTNQILLLIRDRMALVSTVRCPEETYVLDDLEREFGISKNILNSESTRRMQLDSKKKSTWTGGTASALQQKLDDAGFNVLVHRNDPPVNPSLFLTENFQMVAGGDNAYAGRDDAYAGLLGGYLLVNGPYYLQEPAYTAQANGEESFAGNSITFAGAFDSLSKIPYEYTVPTDSDAWGYIFFIGGVATRDVNGELTKIEQGFVPLTRQNEFEEIVLSIKPLETWAGIIITYT